jgi:Zn-finger nucleic acid-binding protein
MPLLMCPNCNSSMQSLKRAEVEFDMCPQCRGVWLDRGELEKILEMERASAPPQPAPQQPPPQQPMGYNPPPQPYPNQPPPGYPPRDSVYGKGYYGKRRSSIFDIFD